MRKTNRTASNNKKNFIAPPLAYNLLIKGYISLPSIEVESVPATRAEMKISIDQETKLRVVMEKRGKGFSPKWGRNDKKKARLVSWLREKPPTDRRKMFLDLYKFDQNPIYLWMLFHECHYLKLSIPEVVMEYISDVAENIWVSAMEGKLLRSLPVLMGFKKPGKTGRGTIESKFRDTDALMLAVLVHEGIKHGLTPTDAINDVAETKHHDAEASVRRAWNRYKTAFK
jgi:hypothetical protein